MKKTRGIIIFVVVFAIFASVIYSVVKTVFPLCHENYILKYSREYETDPYLIMALIKAESNFDEGAVSSKDATGLMQITKSTAEWIAEELNLSEFEYERDITDPEMNIKMGCFYIHYLQKMYNGREKCALAAYNAGFNNVDRWLLDKEFSKDGKNLDKIPFPETEKYVKKISNYQGIYNVLYKDVTEMR